MQHFVTSKLFEVIFTDVFVKKIKIEKSCFWEANLIFSKNNKYSVARRRTCYGVTVLHFIQEGFQSQQNTTWQIQMIVAAPKDARFTNEDIYLAYIDFKYAFGSVDHAKHSVIMEDMGYPKM